MEKSIKLDFRIIRDIDTLNNVMSEELGFAVSNGYAFIDCLSLMRFPDENMSKINLNLEDVLVIQCINFSSANKELSNYLLLVIEEVNRRERERGRTASLLLECITP